MFNDVRTNEQEMKTDGQTGNSFLQTPFRVKAERVG